jgi:hypothetical protein
MKASSTLLARNPTAVSVMARGGTLGKLSALPPPFRCTTLGRNKRVIQRMSVYSSGPAQTDRFAILIYTSTAGGQGTLGGLSSMAEHVG